MRLRLRAIAAALALCLLALTCAAGLAEPAGDGGAGETGGEAAPSAAQAEEEAPQKGLEVYYFDIGRVDAILIRCDGVCAFIDVGFKKDAAPALAYLEALGVDKLDFYIGTHAHSDHVAGAAAIIDALKPDTVLLPHRKVWSAILADADKAQRRTCEEIGYTVLKHGTIFPIGGADVKCLGPTKITSCGVGDIKENENSLILRLTYGAHTFLFTGDTSNGMMREANRAYPGELRADVFKNPHHNGAHDDDVIALVKPKITVFCTDNKSQPGRKYLRALKNAGSRIYITGSDNDGNVLVASDGADLQVYCGYALTKLSLNPLGGTLAPGQEAELTGTLEPKKRADFKKWLNWRSSDPGVVKVSQGKLTAVSEGVATITATSVNGLSDSIEVRVASVGLALNKSSLSLEPGESYQMQVKTSSGDAASLGLEWLSEDPSVAAVTPQGEVLAAGPGETRVIARLSNGAEAACRVVVAAEPVKAVALDKAALSLSVGDQAQLSASLSPADAIDRRLEWASSDEDVATVDENGLVTAVGRGEAKIGVRAASGVYDLCEVKVK